jgi:hypothetical protein
MEAYRGVIGRDAKVVRDTLERLILKLHPQKYLVVFRLQGLGHVLHTATHLAKQLLFNHGCHFSFTGQTFGQASGGCLVPIVVDEQIAEKLVKPGYDLFFVANSPGFGDRSGIGCLEQISCVRAAAQPPFQKGQKSALALDQELSTVCACLVTHRLTLY